MVFNLENEAPNVVTEPRFRELLAEGYEVEIVCRADAYCKASVWYGEWILRVVSPERTVEKILVTTPRTGGGSEDLRFRVFKTINGLSSFVHRMGFLHLHVPFQKDGRATLQLPEVSNLPRTSSED